MRTADEIKQQIMALQKELAQAEVAELPDVGSVMYEPGCDYVYIVVGHDVDGHAEYLHIELEVFRSKRWGDEERIATVPSCLVTTLNGLRK